MRRNPRVYARGRIRHPDHATVTLDGWHEVFSNTEHLSEGERSRWNWRVMRRNPKVYVRGRVRHPDHKTVVLDGWHEVLSNTENLSHAMRNVAFLD